MSQPGLIVFDEDALLFRLHEGLEESRKSVVFVIGAPVTATNGEVKGVADVNGVVEIIRSRFATKPRQLAALDLALSSSENHYQTAFDFISGRLGQDAANKIVKRAVAQALKPPSKGDWDNTIGSLDPDQLKELDNNVDAWSLPPAVDALGQLASEFPERFGGLAITSNFDPLVEVAINKHRGHAWMTSLSTDGSLFQSSAKGCQVVHIHGFWHSTDTLHTSRQLLSTRQSLINDLLSILEDKIVVVIGYGGWPDVFTAAIRSAVSNANALPEILWAFHAAKPELNSYLSDTLGPGIARNRVMLYGGIDCHTFLPRLAQLWSEGLEWSNDEPSPSGQDDVPTMVATEAGRRRRLFRLSPLECDRPPNVQVWVGRENELRALEVSKARTVIICGIGGEGKSALASHYIGSLHDREGDFRHWDWRDCKEQSDRIRTQVIEIIVRFSDGRVSADDLSESDDGELAEVLVDQTSDAQAVLVFDNVDSYVDL